MRLLAFVRTVALLIALVLPLIAAVPADAQGCQHHTSAYDPGKTPEGFRAQASDGCNLVEWTSNTTDVNGSGTYTFKTINPATQPWEPGYTLPGPQGGNYCQYRAVNEANLYFGNLFKVKPGTEVTVRYSCY